MIKEFCLSWEKNKDKLEEYFRNTRQDEYDEYRNLVGLLFDIVINPYFNDKFQYNFDTENIKEIDEGEGDGNGTKIFIAHKDIFSPYISENVYTYVYYGTCSGEDILKEICFFEHTLPDESQIKDYMSICLHLLQRCNYMIEEEE